MSFSKNRIEYQSLLFVLALLSVWAVLRADVIFATFQAGDFAMSSFDYFGVAGGDLPQHFMGYRGLMECPGPQYQHCKAVAPADIGSLKDPMLATGYVAAIIGLWMSMGLEPLFRDLTAQLDREHLIIWTADDTAVLEKRRFMWANCTAVSVGIVVILGFTIFHYGGLPDAAQRLEWEHFISTIILGLLCGHRLGTAAAMGGLSRATRAQRGNLVLTPDHADGMGGARRLGEFLAFQGVVISVPILWLTFWVLIVLNYPDLFGFYGHWLWTHAFLLCIAVFISIFSFLRPLRILASGCAKSKEKLVALWARKSKDPLRKIHSDAGQATDWSVMRQELRKAADISETSEHIAALPEMPLRKMYSGSLSTVTLLPMLAFGIELIAPKDDGFLKLVTQTVRFLTGIGQ